MASKKKLLQAAAGSAAGAGLDIDEAFSTFLYTTDGTSSKTITNNIDLSGEGGLVWLKRRSGSYSHSLYDTERGVQKQLQSDATTAESTETGGLTAFTSTGFTIGNVQNQSALGDMVAWTFRKAPKFFDVVTYTGDDSGNVVKSHSLGSTPGMIIIKNLSSNTGWDVFHRSTTNGLGTGRLFLHSTNAEDNTSTQFLTADSSSITLTHSIVKTGGENYVAYLFAHNDGDGEFGPDADQDIIKCGSYTGVSSTEISVNLGFEPQWVMIKRATGTSLGAYASWFMQDTMRGMVAKGADAKDNVLYANKSSAEGLRGDGTSSTSTEIQIHPNATGFTVPSTNSVEVNQAGETYIYMAIRRGPLAEPTSATDVFGVDYAYTYDVDGNTGGSSAQLVGYIGKPADLNIQGYRSGSSFNAAVYDRLRNNKYLITNTTSAEASVSGNFWDNMTGFREVASAQDTTIISWTWKRAPGYFDVVTYTGNDTARTIQHNLGVVPEMIWVKKRSSSSNWSVLHSGLNTAGNEYIRLDLSSAKDTNVQIWNGTVPTDTVFSIGASDQVNHSYQSSTYIAYLFATLAGISKVGSYTGNGSTQTIDCGFSSGARFVLIKRTDSSQHWILFDSTRGIVSGNDPSLKLSDTEAEYSGGDDIDPTSSGFIINNDTANGYQLSTSGASYIFYAIA